MDFQRSVFTILLCFIWFAASAQISLDPEKKITQYGIDAWNIENGMPSNSVLDVLNSTSGYMWFATFDGLVRFDGIDFRLYNESNYPDFKATGTLSLFEDHHRNLWIGTNGRGLVKLKGNEFTTFYDPELHSNVFRDIVEDKDGYLWLGSGSGVVKFKDGKFSHDPNLDEIKNVPVLDLLIDEKGTLWLATTGKGVFKYIDGRLEQFTTEEGLNNNSVRTLTMNNEGDLIIGTNNGTNVLRNGKIGLFDIGKKYQKSIVNRIIQDDKNTYWIGSDDGLIKINGDKIEYLTKNEGLPDKTIQGMDMDREGSLWFGTYRGGIFRLKDGKFVNYGEREGLPNNIVNVAFEEDHVIYVGTDDGLGIIDSGEITSYSFGEEFNQSRVRDITKDKNGSLWLATYDGLINFNDGEILKKYSTNDGLSSDKVRVLEEDSQGNLWIGTGKGLNILENGQISQFNESGLENMFIMAILKDSRDRMWVGTDGSGVFLIETDGNIQALSTDNGLSSNVTFQITEDKNGVIWIGTNSGISIIEDGKISTIDFKKGLISNAVFQIIFDWNNEVWITTTQGLQHFEYENLRKVFSGEIERIENSSVFNNFEGMRSRLITGASISTLCSNGTLLVPTLRGLTRIDPANLSINTIPPPVLITEAFLNNKPASYDEDIVVPADIQNVEIHYTGLSLYAPDKVRFRYKLEPFDKEWNDVGTRRVAYYTNIPNGEYTFRVVAANNDGKWNEVGASINVTKEAFFYEEAWFYLIVLVIVALMGYGGYKYRVRSLKRMNAELLRQVHERTKDIASQTQAIEKQAEELEKLNSIKDKLFSIISHDLKSPLNSLVGILKLLSVGSLKPEEVKTLTGKLEVEVEGLSAMLTNLLSWAKTQMKGISAQPVEINLKEIVDDNIKLAEGDARKKEIVINNHISDQSAYADKEMLNLIFRNLISNALKFTDRNGTIDINAQSNGKMVQVYVQDNGVGISEENAAKLFSEEEHYSMLGTSKEAGTGLGLMLCKEFIEKNEGRIWVESELGKGSNFIFEIPKTPASVKMDIQPQD